MDPQPIKKAFAPQETRCVTFVTWNIGDGGCQRVMVHLANHWAAKGWCLNILTLQGAAVNPAFTLSPSVSVHDLDFPRLSEKAWPKCGLLMQLCALRKTIRKMRPNVVIGFMDQPSVLAVMALLGSRVPVIATEHSDPNERPIPIRWESYRRWMYPRASAVVTQTDEALAYFPPSVRKHGRALPNPVVLPSLSGITTKRRPVVVSMGRLENVKGFDRLIDAFALAAPSVPEWSLEIWGEGTDRKALEAQIKTLGLTDRVRLPGYTTRPGDVLRAADLFVISSRTESWSMVLCEAMAFGVPSISFDCPSGPRHIIRHDLDGLLVPNGNVRALAQAMKQLMTDAQARQRLSERSPEVLDRFSVLRVAGLWEELISEVCR